MNQTEISEKEFAVIREISNNHKPNQRVIAKRAGISLGLTNLIIKRLIKKGYIKIQEAPPRTIIYSLTPKGLAEKTHKSYLFTLRTIDIMRQIKKNIKDIIYQEYEKGARNCIISGNGELAAFTEIALHELNLKEMHYSRLKDEPEEARLYCHLIIQKDGSEKKIDIISELSRKGDLS